MVSVQNVMGTTVSYHVHGLSTEAFNQAIAAAACELTRIDQVFSTYKTASVFCQWRAGAIPPSNELAAVLTSCQHAKNASHGSFDPWSLSEGIDPSGYVKGWAAQRAANIIMQAGACGVMVNAGGDISCLGKPDETRDWRVGIRQAKSAETMAAIVSAPAIATSAAYERGQHVHDPAKNTTAVHVASATVCGPDLGMADALATGLFASGVAGLTWLEQVSDYTGLVEEHNGQLHYSNAFPIVSD